MINRENIIAYNQTTVNYKYLRKHKADTLKEWHSQNFEGKPFIKKENLTVESYKSATILPMKKFDEDPISRSFGRGGVVDKDNNYVILSELSERLSGGYEFSNEEFIDEKVVYCGYFINHWGHFLVDTIVRLWYVLENDTSIDKYVFMSEYGNDKEPKGNYKEFFELLGIANKVRIVSKPTRFREVVVPELGYKEREFFSEPFKNMFDFIARAVKPLPEWEKTDKLFLTRSQFNKSTSIDSGMDMIDNFFHKNGYMVIAPETISLSQLIYLIRNSKVCAAMSGTLPHHMLFTKDNHNMVILERNPMNNVRQVDINLTKNLNVTYIDTSLALYPVNLAVGPFIYYYKGYLESFANDNNYIAPDKKFLTEKYTKGCVAKYIKGYRSLYQYQWYTEDDWYLPYMPSLREAYLDSLNYLGDYIYGRKPFKLSHYFELHYIKQIVKSIIGR